MGAGTQSTAATSGMEMGTGAPLPLAQRSVDPSVGPLRVLLAERRATAHSDLSRRLASLGHEVLARVTSAQGAVDYAGFLCPDVVLISPVLEDGIGITAAMSVTRGRPGVAAVVLTNHPAAVNPTARPNWGAVGLVPADAEEADLDTELRRVVSRAREAASQAGLQAVRPNPSPAPAVSVVGDVAEASAAPAVTAVADVVVASQSLPAIAPTRDAGYDDAVNELVDDVFDPPSPDREPIGTPDGPVDATDTADFSAASNDIVEQALQSLVERSRLQRADALRLMEQEAADTGQSVSDVARAMLGDAIDATVSGEVVTV